MRSQAPVHALDFCELDPGVQDAFLHLWLGQVASGIGADVGQPVPLVHAKLTHANLDIQPVVVVLVHSPFGQVGAKHLLMNILATLDLGDQSSSRLGKCAETIPKEVFPPLMLPIVRARRTLAGAYADKPGPLVDSRFIQDLRRRIIRTCTLIDKEMLADLNWFKS
jgi:hypothetical protein